MDMTHRVILQAATILEEADLHFQGQEEGDEAIRGTCAYLAIGKAKWQMEITEEPDVLSVAPLARHLRYEGNDPIGAVVRWNDTTSRETVVRTMRAVAYE